MNPKVFRSGARVLIVMLAIAGAAWAQDGKQTKLRGLINDYTPATVSGPWETRGEWSLKVNWDLAKANFSAALTMERSDEGVLLNGGGDFTTPAGRHAHTHHVRLVNGDVTLLSNGFRITGVASVSGNGNVAPDFAQYSPIQIDITGGSLVQYSNIKLSFREPASNHLGTLPFNGVVRDED
jgi:hypothetical protein